MTAYSIDMMGALDDFEGTIRRELDDAIQLRLETFLREVTNDARSLAAKVAIKVETSKNLRAQRYELAVSLIIPEAKSDFIKQTEDDLARLRSQVSDLQQRLAYIYLLGSS